MNPIRQAVRHPSVLFLQIAGIVILFAYASARADDKKYLEAGAKSIKKRLPEIRMSVLAADKEAIEGMTKAVTDAIRKKGAGTEDGVTEGVVRNSMIWTWAELRSRRDGIGLETRLTEERVLQEISDSVLLSIKTQPDDGADVYVDGTKLDDPSNTSVYVAKGKRTVRAEKDGKSDEQDCTVKPNQRNIVTLTLK